MYYLAKTEGMLTLYLDDVHCHNLSEMSRLYILKKEQNFASTLLQYGDFSEPLVMYYAILEIQYYAGILIVLLDDSSTNRLFTNSMEGIDRLRYNPGVVFLSSFYTITASMKVENM